MKKLITGISVLLFMMTFFATAYADVIDPGRGPRPPRPEIPVIRAYEMRKPDFAVIKAPDKKNTYLLQVTLPGPCNWRYFVLNEKKETEFVSEKFENPDFDKETESREIVLKIPRGEETAIYYIEADYMMYQYTQTRFGPKRVKTSDIPIVITHTLELQKAVNGNTISVF